MENWNTLNTKLVLTMNEKHSTFTAILKQKNAEQKLNISAFYQTKDKTFTFSTFNMLWANRY